MFKIGSGIKKEQTQLVWNWDIMEIWWKENRKELDKCLGKIKHFTQESSKMISYMEKGLPSSQMELFMMEIVKMEKQMEWESCSTSEKMETRRSVQRWQKKWIRNLPLWRWNLLHWSIWKWQLSWIWITQLSWWAKGHQMWSVGKWWIEETILNKIGHLWQQQIDWLQKYWLYLFLNFKNKNLIFNFLIILEQRAS